MLPGRLEARFPPPSFPCPQQVPLENVPSIQKEIVQRCRQHGKPVIVASHLLQSMHTVPTPTRAEVRRIWEGGRLAECVRERARGEGCGALGACEIKVWGEGGVDWIWELPMVLHCFDRPACLYPPAVPPRCTARSATSPTACASGPTQ